MFCGNCGSPIADKSKFCTNCGKPITPKEEDEIQNLKDASETSSEVAITETEVIDVVPEVPEVSEVSEVPEVSTASTCDVNEIQGQTINSANRQNTTTPPPPTTKYSGKNPISTKKILFGISAIVIVALLSFIIGIYSLSGGEPSYSADLMFTSNSSESGKLTEKQKKVRELMTEDVLQLVEEIVVRDFYLPDTTKVKHDKSSWNIENSLYTFGGTVTYPNKEGKQETETYIMKAFVGKKATLGVYGKLGKRELYDNQHKFNTLGAAAYQEAIEYDGAEFLGGLFSIHDEEYQKVTLEEYRRIKTGMSYAEVTEIIGSLGTFAGEAGTDKKNYTWVGNGNKDSKATITFSEKQVYTTAQVGLK
ncbi:MAG: zinc-ribbon domain-containing protein [Clostridium sp.]|uniref:zinc-ribbon domain-containing protein n=1 Tax=Clostridium sp. TaxID=1506 RepID=UPI002914BC80|nr:zinc-ribbon domain-containing protein [Clostridium sp.]MDU7339372.1 zinc-ribbon domain-containing protein [Clostridium sp.]